MQALLTPQHGVEMNQDPDQLEPVLAQLFVFAYVWGLGGNLMQPCQAPFTTFMHNQFAKLVTLPTTGTVLDFFVDLKKVKTGGVGAGIGPPEMRFWSSKVPSFTFNRSMPFFQMLVPTVDTVRFSFLLEVGLRYTAEMLEISHSLLPALCGASWPNLAVGLSSEIAHAARYTGVPALGTIGV